MNTEIIINKKATLKEALLKLDSNPRMQTLLIEDEDKIIGTITDGDIRRGIIKGLGNEMPIYQFMNDHFTFLINGLYEKEKLDYIREKKLEIIPVLNNDGSLNRIINFNIVKTILPIDAVIMAGGKGTRLMPLTQDIPKPMLKVGEKPIMEYNIDLLQSYGIKHITLSVKHLAQVIMDYYNDGESRDLDIKYVTESQPLGTIGAVKQIKNFYNEYILVMNSDLLTNINLEAMFNELIANDAEMVVASTDYKVQIPYGVLESEGKTIKALKEKPTYTYYSNAGIYIFKKSCVNYIPDNSHFNATDLLEKLLTENKKVLHYNIKKYWLDIGKHIDFKQAQEDIKNLTF